jgi:hypothetical protein
MSRWEAEPRRQLALHRRRYELLEPPVGALSEVVFAQLVWQGRFDLGFIASELCELHARVLDDAGANSTPRATRRAALAPHVERVVECFTRFLALYGATDGVGAGAGANAFVQAHIHMARAHGKLIDSAAALRESLRHYEMVDAHLRQQGDVEMMAEGDLCRQMIVMLPALIARLPAEPDVR